MKKKKYIVIILIILIILATTIFFAVRLLKNKDGNEKNIQVLTTTREEREVWNKFLNENPYLSQIEEITTEHMFILSTDLLKIALTTDNIATERIVEDEIKETPLLTEGDGYKKSRKAIDEYMKELLGLEELRYNLVDSYVEGGNYIIINDDYVYFTKIELPEKIYIATSYKVENENYEVEIYEYNVIEENKETLENMLETGTIDGTIEKASSYKITGTLKGENIKIDYKKSL